MFSEFYFYLLGNIKNINKKEHFRNEDDIFPTIYRIGRIKEFEVMEENFMDPYYSNRFEEGKFRKRIHFMTDRKLRKVKFIYKDASIESVLDRVPTAKIINQKGREYIITAEVFLIAFKS